MRSKKLSLDFLMWRSLTYDESSFDSTEKKLYRSGFHRELDKRNYRQCVK